MGTGGTAGTAGTAGTTGVGAYVSGVFYSVENFLETLRSESATTARVLASLTDASLEVRATDSARSLGELAWHVVTAIQEIGARAALRLSGPARTEEVPRRAEEIRAAYVRCSGDLATAVTALSDVALLDRVDVYGEEWAVGRVLYVLLAHEIHHRGQIVSLIRVAELAVP